MQERITTNIETLKTHITKKNMKRLFTSLCLLFAVISLHAKPIDKESAMKNAQTFLRTKGYHGRKAPGRVFDLKAVETSFEGSFYVFDIGQKDGFVIVSAHDQTQSILGYVEEGCFEEGNIPENMKAWLQFYREEMDGIGDNEVSLVESADNKEAIAPLITTQWNQDAPYNYECHLGLIDSYALTGCAATAMAQIMYFHKWPQTTSKEIPAYTINYAGYGKKEWEAQPVYSFDWDNMKSSYTGSESTTDVSAIAVAKLMRYCGQSVKMNYSNIASGATANSIPNALKTYFGYDADLKYVRRSTYSIQGWANLIYNELKNMRPVFYGGQSESEGHGFICDGYDEKGFFHINWGWGGQYDGFFRLSVLDNKDSNSNASGEGFSMSQEAIIGIMPENNTTDTYASGDYTSGTVSLDATIDGPDEVDVGVSTKYTIIVNNTGDEFNENLYVFVDGSKNSTFGLPIASRGTESVEVSLLFPTEGSHVIKVTTDANGNNVIAQRTIIAIIASNVVNGLISDIKVEGLVEENGEYILHGTSISVVYSFTNVTDEDYTGKLQMLYSYSGGTSGRIMTGTIKARQSYSYTLNIEGYYGLTITFLSKSLVPNSQDEYKMMKQLTIKLVEATGISDVNIERKESDTYYNMNGVKMGRPTKPGIYIHNGKKVFVK